MLRRLLSLVNRLSVKRQEENTIMCKLLGWVYSGSISEKKATTALKVAYTAIAATEKDGFGYAQPPKEDGTGLHARFVSPDEFRGLGSLTENKALFAGLWDMMPVAKRAKEAGAYDPAAPMIIHGRTSTNSVRMDCTHPFKREMCALAHNGVVRRLDDKYETKTVCDTEHLINALWKADSLELALADIKENVSGYAAILTFTKWGTMFIGRDDTASLTITPFKLSGKTGYVFATKGEHGRLVAGALSTVVGEPFEFPKQTGFEFTHSGEFVRSLEFDTASYARASLSGAASSAFAGQGYHYEGYNGGTKRNYAPHGTVSSGTGTAAGYSVPSVVTPPARSIGFNQTKFPPGTTKAERKAARRAAKEVGFHSAEGSNASAEAELDAEFAALEQEADRQEMERQLGEGGGAVGSLDWTPGANTGAGPSNGDILSAAEAAEAQALLEEENAARAYLGSGA